MKSLEEIINSTKKTIKRTALNTALFTFGTLACLAPFNGCSKSTNTPTTPNIPPTHIEEQHETTNSNGLAYFNDDGREVEIKVVDQNNNPISNANVNYINGEDDSFDIFLTYSENYLPELRGFNHRSKSSDLTHTLILTGKQIANYALRTIFGTDEKEALMNYLSFIIPQSLTHAYGPIFYNTTMTSEEVVNAGLANIHLGIFLGKKILGGDALEIASAAVDNLPLNEWLVSAYGEDKTWDIYVMPTLSISNPTKIAYLLIESNQPEITLRQLSTNNTNILVDAQITDSEVYNYLLFSIPDPTNRILGPTTEFDPLFTRKIIRFYNGQEILVSSVSNSPISPPWTISMLPSGNYKLQVEVTDDTRVNKTLDEILFNIGEISNDQNIVFASNRDGNYEIYIVSESGTNLQKLTNHPSEDRWPRWSPNGEQIVFMSYRTGDPQLFLMNKDGTGLRQLTDKVYEDDSILPIYTEAAYPTWHPNGYEIYYTQEKLNDSHNAFIKCLYKININDLTRTKIIESQLNYPIFEPSISPDGQRIAYIIPPLSDKYTHSELYLSTINGTNIIQLTNDHTFTNWPSWHPNGQSILFVSQNKLKTITPSGLENVIEENGMYIQDPMFSPDGQKIVYSFHGPNDTGYERKIWIMNSDGSNQHRITSGPGEDVEPDWK